MFISVNCKAKFGLKWEENFTKMRYFNFPKMQKPPRTKAHSKGKYHQICAYMVFSLVILPWAAN